jgi:hypothetical protein
VEIFTSQGAPPASTTLMENLPPVSTIPAAKLPPVSTTPVANLPSVSTTPVANFAISSASVVDICGKQWEQYQTADNFKMNLMEKNFLYANSATQRCPKEIMKTFLIEDFFHLPLVSMTPVVQLVL